VSSQAESGGTEWNVECGGSAEPHGGGGGGGGGGTPTEFRCEGATGWAGRPLMKFKELAGIEKSHCWARGWVWGRWGTGVCVGVSWGECQAILGRIGRMSGFLVGYFRFGKSGSGSGSGSLGCPNFVVQNT